MIIKSHCSLGSKWAHGIMKVTSAYTHTMIGRWELGKENCGFMIEVEGHNQTTGVMANMFALSPIFLLVSTITLLMGIFITLYIVLFMMVGVMRVVMCWHV